MFIKDYLKDFSDEALVSIYKDLKNRNVESHVHKFFDFFFAIKTELIKRGLEKYL